jgi:hypothetical protein
MDSLFAGGLRHRPGEQQVGSPGARHLNWMSRALPISLHQESSSMMCKRFAVIARRSGIAVLFLVGLHQSRPAELPGAPPNPLNANKQHVIFVSPHGSDLADGTKDRPLLTLSAAVDRVAEILESERNQSIRVP